MNIGSTIGIAIAVAIGLTINALMGRKARKAAEKLSDEDKSQLGESFTIRQPKGRLVASIFLVLLLCGGPLSLLIIYFDKVIDFYQSAETAWDATWQTLLMVGVFLPLVFLALWSLARAVVWKVQVDGDKIEFTSMTGKKKEFTFKDITEVRSNTVDTGQAINVYVGGKRAFTVDQPCENFYLLVTRLAERGTPC